MLSGSSVEEAVSEVPTNTVLCDMLTDHVKHIESRLHVRDTAHDIYLNSKK